MPVLRTNILVNYAGQIWIALMGVVFIPLYIRVLGIEAFGLVGLMLSIQTLSTLLDFGMGGMLNREISRRIHDAEKAGTLAALVRTLETLAWPIAAAIAVMIWLVSDPLAAHWLHPHALARETTAHAITIMGLAVALIWPSNFYANGLSGLECQPILNFINAAFATLRGAGVLVVLYWISPTIAAFMWWYAAMGACQSLLSAVALWRRLPPSRGPVRFSFAEIRGTHRFAGGLVAISVLSITVMQLDRIVVSAVRPLEELGYFSLALSVAAGMGRMIQPMFNALYPRYSRLVVAGDRMALSQLYHLSNQYLAVVIAAVSAVLIVFSKDVLYLWTGDAALAAVAAVPLSILVAGTAFNGLMNLPYALQLAHGWTRLTIGANLVALILGIPVCVWLVRHFGIVGAACVWFMTNVGFVAVAIPMMHRRLMRGELADWYLRDILPAFLTAGAMGLLAAWFIPSMPRNILGLLMLITVCTVTLFVTALTAPPVRAFVRHKFDKIGSSRG